MNNTNAVSSSRRVNTMDMVYVAIGSALIAVCSWISIPTAVPFTLQTFAVFFILLTLGGRIGTMTVLVYIAMGAVGLPVFAGFKGGIGAIFGNTGGYILGFLIAGLIYTVFTGRMGNKPVTEIIALVTGLAVCYAFGTAWFMVIYLRNTGPVGIATVLAWCVFPFIIPDLIKMALAVLISKRVRPVIEKTVDERGKMR